MDIKVTEKLEAFFGEVTVQLVETLSNLPADLSKLLITDTLSNKLEWTACGVMLVGDEIVH